MVTVDTFQTAFKLLLFIFFGTALYALTYKDLVEKYPKFFLALWFVVVSMYPFVFLFVFPHGDIITLVSALIFFVLIIFSGYMIVKILKKETGSF